MKHLKNRKTAISVTSFLILLSILFGAHSSLTGIRDRALDIFYTGEKADGKGIQSDLEYISDQCYNLTVVAGRYMDKGDARIEDILKKRDRLDSAATPGDKYRAKEELIEAAMSLYEDMGTMELEERDRYYRDGFAADVESRQLIISHSSYNENAIAFNKCLKRFPANILSKITFVKPLELYE
jgi:hypothetical protein